MSTVSRDIRSLLGIIIIALGVVLGLYVGAWVMFVGGIVQVVNAVKATPVEAQGIAVGVLRIAVATPAGWFAAALLIWPGKSLL